jgi:phage terminase large subunit-like protein
MLDAEPTPTVYTQVHTAPEGCEVDDRKAWKAANPGLGHFLSEADIADAAAMAKRMPSFEPAFRLLNLNQRVDAESRVINPADWEANGIPFDPLELEGKRCFGGLDLGSTSDLTAFALWFPDEGKLLVWHFVPKDRVAERVEKDRVPYDQWAAAGHIITPNGRATDHLAIVKVLAEVRQAYDVQEIAFDKWRIEGLLKLMNDEGITLPMVPFQQGFVSMGPAVDAFETALFSGMLQHNNNPVLTWQASNLVVEMDAAANRKPAKNKSSDKVDGLVATIMACGLAAAQRTDDGHNADALLAAFGVRNAA